MAFDLIMQKYKDGEEERIREDTIDHFTHFEKKIIPPSICSEKASAHEAIQRIQDIIDSHEE